MNGDELVCVLTCVISKSCSHIAVLVALILISSRPYYSQGIELANVGVNK